MERYCSTGQSPQRAVAPMEEEEGLSKLAQTVMLPAYICLVSHLNFCQHNGYPVDFIVL
jgi:hypothetical protein